MDKFRTRIKFYLVGLGIGTLLVYFMFGNRGCSWLPANRVKNMIGEKEIIIGDSVLAVMECLKLSNDEIYDLLKSKGDVEFSLSKTQGIPKIYHIEGAGDDFTYTANFALYEEEDYAEVVEVSKQGANTACNITQSNKSKSVLPLPRKDVISILEKNEFRILELAETQMQELGIQEEELLNFHKTADIVMKESKPRKSPNPYYILKGELAGKKVKIQYVVGEIRTRIADIHVQNKNQK